MDKKIFFTKKSDIGQKNMPIGEEFFKGGGKVKKGSKNDALPEIQAELSLLYKLQGIDKDMLADNSVRKTIGEIESLKKMAMSEDFNLEEGMDNYFARISSERPAQKQSRRKTPSGKQSALSNLQYESVRGDSFKEWFGDWEKENTIGVSKVVNEKTGEPLVVFHGTKSPNEFSRYKFDRFPVMYFSEDVDYAKWFANLGDGVMYESFLDIKELGDFSVYGITKVPWTGLVNFAKEKHGVELPEKHPTFGYGEKKFWEWLRNDLPHQTLIKAYKDAGYTGFKHVEDNPNDPQKDGTPRVTDAYTIFTSEQAKDARGLNNEFSPYQVVTRLKKGGHIKKSLMNKIKSL